MFLWGSKMPEPNKPKQPISEPEFERDTEAEIVRAWRVAAGMALGMEWADAVKLADSGADMHQAARIIELGATPAQVLRILT